jgi:urease accessory protein
MVLLDVPPSASCSGQPAAPATPLSAIRAVGEVALGFERRGSVTRMATAYQHGCLRARLPRIDPDARAEVVLLNTGGGCVGGDTLDQTIRWGESAVATVTAQAAEKIYRAVDMPARVATRIVVEADADAEWMPQETILFDGARLDRRLEVEIQRGARFLGVEALLFGRAAMGESMIRGSLVDRWRVRREGRLVYADTLMLQDNPEDILRLAAIADGARAIATVLLVDADAGARLDAVRAILADAPGLSAASSWNGLLVARFVARQPASWSTPAARLELLT